MANQPRLSPEAFSELQAKLTKFSVEANELARLVFVDGKPPSAAAQALGMSRQNANNQLRRIKALMNGQPVGWVQLNEWMPAWLATETRAKLKEEMEKLK